VSELLPGISEALAQRVRVVLAARRDVREKKDVRRAVIYGVRATRRCGQSRRLASCSQFALRP
jgi:hypothetical protein